MRNDSDINEINQKEKLLSVFRSGNPETLSNQMSEGGPLKNKKGENEEQLLLVLSTEIMPSNLSETKWRL
jgi:hypothetical protein